MRSQMYAGHVRIGTGCVHGQACATDRCQQLACRQRMRYDMQARVQVVTYIWSPQEEGQFQPGRSSRWWLYNSLQSLDKQLRDRGNQICFREGDNAVDQLLQVCQEAGSTCVFFNNVYDPLSLVRGHEVKQRLQAAGVVARSFNAELLREPWEIYNDDSTPHTTFKGFWNTCAAASQLPATRALSALK